MRQMRRTLTSAIYISSLLAALALWPNPLFATTYTVKAGGGGNYATIGACMSAMSSSGGDTCTVYAGTYAENFTITAGTAGHYNVLTVNGSDAVTINGSATVNSHTKLVGNCPALTGNVITTATCGFFFSQPSSPTNTCLGFPGSQITDYWIEYNVFYACHAITESESASDTYGYYIGNTLSYTDTTSSSPDDGCGIETQGDHKLLENNELTHVGEGFRANGKYQVVRNNRMHDTFESEVSGAHCDSHIDFNETTPGSGSLATQYILFEGDANVNSIGADSHMFLTQNYGNGFGPVIERFNMAVHVGGAGIVDDTSWTYVKAYNNTWVDVTDGGSGHIVNNIEGGSSNASDYNDIFYFPEAVTDDNAIATDSSTGPTFTGAYNLAYCTGGCSGLHNYTYGSGNWTNVSSNMMANPLFVSYLSSGLGDLHLSPTSPALNAGTYLTTVSASDSGSGSSLKVNDANFFQDGWGFPAGTGAGQMNPDCVSVTAVSNHICITAVNYSTNTLTLASSITRSPGDKVWLYSDSKGVVRLTGTAPNIGALGLLDTVSGNPPAPPTQLVVVSVN